MAGATSIMRNISYVLILCISMMCIIYIDDHNLVGYRVVIKHTNITDTYMQPYLAIFRTWYAFRIVFGAAETAAFSKSRFKFLFFASSANAFFNS